MDNMDIHQKYCIKTASVGIDLKLGGSAAEMFEILPRD